MLGVTKVNFNIVSNGLVEIKIKGGMILQDLKIPQKLLKIFTFLILTNSDLTNQQYAKMREKGVENLEFSSTIAQSILCLNRGLMS